MKGGFVLRATAAASAFFIGGSALALPPEGQYARRATEPGSAPTVNCPNSENNLFNIVRERIGMGEGGTCHIKSSVEVRDMNAALQDMYCNNEGHEYAFRMFIVERGDGIMAVGDTFEFDLIYCFPIYYEGE